MRHLTSRSQKQTPLLFVILPRIAIRSVDIGLIPAHRELVRRSHGIRHHYAAIVNSTVPTRSNAVIRLQLEILRRPPAQDDDLVPLDQRLRSDLAAQRPAFRPPIL